MRRRRIQWFIFSLLAAMTLCFQIVNFRHIYLALVPYHRSMAVFAALAFTFIPVAVVLANTFRSSARDPRVMRVLFGVAAMNFIGEALANLAMGAHDANGDATTIHEVAALFDISYKFALFTGAVVYAMALSVMVAGLVWAVTAAANELMGTTASQPINRVPTDYIAMPAEEQVLSRNGNHR